jgi:putative oxidoreductase
MALQQIHPLPTSRPRRTRLLVPRRLRQLQRRGAKILALYSISALRVSLGLIFFGFGALKFFPGLSPAEALVIQTVDTLTFGVVTGETARLLTALVECTIGVTLLTGRFLRLGLAVMALAMVGIMAPIVLFFDDLFPGAPTLVGQYVLKDVVLLASGAVVAASALGARLVVDS